MLKPFVIVFPCIVLPLITMALAQSISAAPYDLSRQGASHDEDADVDDVLFDPKLADAIRDLDYFQVKHFDANATTTVRYRLNDRIRLPTPVGKRQTVLADGDVFDSWMRELIRALGVKESQYEGSLLSIMNTYGLEARDRASADFVIHEVHNDGMPSCAAVLFIERCGADETAMLPTHVVTLKDEPVACNDTKSIVTFHNNFAAGHRASGLRESDPTKEKPGAPGQRSSFYRVQFYFDKMVNADGWISAFKSGELASLGMATFFPDHMAFAYARAAQQIDVTRATEIFNELILTNMDHGTKRVAPILFAHMAAVGEIQPEGKFKEEVDKGFVALWLAGLAGNAWNPNGLLPPDFELPVHLKPAAKQEFNQFVKELGTFERCREAQMVAESKGVVIGQAASIRFFTEEEQVDSEHVVIAYYDAVQDRMVGDRPIGVALVAVARVMSALIEPSYPKLRWMQHFLKAGGSGRSPTVYYQLPFVDLGML